MSSGFSFLIEKTDVINVEQIKKLMETPTSVETPKGLTMSFPDHHSKVLAPNISELEQDIKFTKSSETRLVKKKKRAPKIGFARGNDCGDEDIDMTNSGYLYDSSLSDSVSQPDSESTVPNFTDEELSSSAANLSAQMILQSDQRLVLPADLAVKESVGAVNCRNLHTDPDGNRCSSNGLNIERGTDESSTIDLSEFISPNQSSSQQEQQMLLQSKLKAVSPLKLVNADPILDPSSGTSGPTSGTTSNRNRYSVAGSEILPVPDSHHEEIADIAIAASMTSSTGLATAAAALPLFDVELDRAPSSMFNGMLLSSEVKEQVISLSDNSRPITKISNSIEAKNVLSPANVAARLDSHSVEIPIAASITLVPERLSRSDVDVRAASIQGRGMLPSVSSPGTGKSHWTIEDEDVDMSHECSMAPNASNNATASATVTSAESNGGYGSTAVIESNAYTKAADIAVDFRKRLDVLMSAQWIAGKDKSDRRKELKRLTQYLREAKIKCADMEADQLRLAGLEQFDEADLLTGTLDSLLAEISTHTERCRHLKEQELEESIMASGDSAASIEVIRTAQMEAITHTMASLSTISGEEERRIAANLNGRAAQLALEDCRLLRERERVAVEESYIADEERALAEQTAEVEELIATQGGDNNIRRAELEAKQAEVDLEIEELEKKLRQKKAEKESSLTELDRVNEKINQIRGTFHRQILRVEDRKTLLDRIRQSCSTDREALIATEKNQREQQHLIEKIMRKSEMWCIRMKKEMAALAAVAETLFTAPDPITPSLTLHVAQEEQFTSMRDELSAVDDVLNSTLKAQGDLIRLRGTLDLQAKEALELGVKLETEKKAHALARRFKEAAAVAKEEKVNISSRDELQEAIARNVLQIHERSVEICDLEKSKEALALALSVAREKIDAILYAKLKKREIELQSSLTDLMATLDAGEEGIGDEVEKMKIENRNEMQESTTVDWQISPSLYETALELIKLNIQELELEIEDLEEVYPAFKSAAASLSSTLASSPTTIEGDIQNSSQDTYVHQHQQNLSSGDGDCGDTGDHDIAEASHIEGSAALSSSEREVVNDDKDSIISQVKVWVAELSSLEGQLLIATEDEDYEVADTIDSSIKVTRAKLAASLDSLQMTVDEAVN